MRRRWLRTIRAWAAAVLCAASTACGAEAPVDVVVYGSTPAGFCAAIAAAREGASVVLLEPTAHVGGVNTGGLSFSDSNQTVRTTMRGLFEEWHERVERDYHDRGVALPYKVTFKDQAKWTYEPHVAMRVTHALLDEAKVRTLTKRQLRSVVKDGATLTSIRTDDGDFSARVFIDATYEGDLLAAAGVEWTIGREGRADYDESYAGRQYPKPAMNFSGVDAAGKLLPLLTTAERGAEEIGDRIVMVYSFRLCLTKDPANRVPFPAPTKYDPDRFEALRRYYATDKQPRMLWDLYPLPGDKYDANNGIGAQFSMGLVGGCNGWSEADPAECAKLFDAHKQYTLELYRFLTTDSGVPEKFRNELAAFGLCRDEFPDDGHWSPQLYVREGRRMRGAYVLTQRNVLREPKQDDAIAVSSFPIDSHDCRRVALMDGGVINEGTIFPVRMPGRRHGYAYQVPYRSITPQAEQAANLLVPVALSCTHVAFSSIRVEPTWMVIGQSAGVAAALAAKSGTTVQKLDYATLRERLLAQHQALDLPTLPDVPPTPVGGAPAASGGIDPTTVPGIVLDDARAELAGDWSRSSNFKPHLGVGYLHDERRGDGHSSATFRLTPKESGKYELRLAYSPHPTRATKVPLDVTTGDRTTRLIVDQTQPLPKSDAFRTVGTIELTAGRETTIVIRNEKTDGFVIVDALQLLRKAD